MIVPFARPLYPRTVTPAEPEHVPPPLPRQNKILSNGEAFDVLKAALGRAVKLLAIGSVARLLLGILASRVLAVIVYQASPRDPVVLAGVVAAMSLLGLVGTWIPAQRALSVNPLILLREE